MSFRNEDFNRHKSLVDRLRSLAEGDAGERGYVFLVDGEAEEQLLSLDELDRRARAVAARLQAHDARGARVLLVYPSGLEFLTGFFGCLYAGAVAVPTYYPRLNALDPRLKAILDDSDATIALTTTAVLSKLDRVLSDAPEMRRLTWLSSEDASGAEEWVRPEHDGGTLAMLQYTSGSTGSPRGVMLTHRNLMHNLCCIQRTFRLYGPDCGVSWLPAFHDMGLIGNLLAPMQYNGRVVFMSPAAFVQRPIRWLRAVSRYRAYISGGPTFAYDLCVRCIGEEERAGLDLSAWHVAYVGAEPVSAAVLERFAETYAPYGFRAEALHPCYGLAEATLLVSGSRKRPEPSVVRVRRADLEQHRVNPTADEAASVRLVGCGEPMPDERVLLVDPVTNRVCDPGRVGEVWVAGKSVAAGYWRQPEATEQTFGARLTAACGLAQPDTPPDAYLRTGDLAFLHDGELFITGRIKDVLIVRGRNFYPQDIEAAVDECHPALRAGAGVAFAVPAGDEERVVVVHERDRRHRDTDPEEVFAAVRRAVMERLELEVSAVLLIKPMTLPRTTSGKVRRSETRAQYLASSLEVVARWQCAPEGEPPTPITVGATPARTRDEVRAWLLARLARHLRLPEERLDVKRPFAAYGLDSVTMVSISAELQTWLGRTLPPTLLYDAPTIEALSERLTATAPGGSTAALGPQREPIAVIGIGCRFPGADSPDDFWRLLREGRHAVTDLPKGRWSHTPDGVISTRGGYLSYVDRFDPLFFGISPRETVSLDPQHRLLLETTWEALEDAGHAPESLEGGRVGVFVGISGNEYARILLAARGVVDAYGGTGTASSMAANRVSYHFDFRGPSLSLDTACSSSLVAVHQACRSLRDDECEIAVVGGVNLLLTPEVTQTFSLAGMLASDGRCKTFDSSADGYVRGEGCGVVVLRPLTAALRDGDRILAVVRGSAVNQDGRSNGITAPNGVAQVTLIAAALRDAGVSPEEVGYVEAHGTGTRLGDPIEFGALAAALGDGDRPCAVGAVKTNIGHLEAAAGIAGLIKVVLSLHHGQIPPHLHLRELNPDIPLSGSRFVIPTANLDWPDGPRVAGVSSFGFGGTNAHVVLAGAPVPSEEPASAAERPLHLLTLSARSEKALHALAARHRDWLAAHPDTSVADVCSTAARGRSHFTHRLGVPAGTTPELAAVLTDFLAGMEPRSVRVGRLVGARSANVAFLFTGQGTLTNADARELYDGCPPFREAFERCAGVLGDQFARPLHDILRSTAGPLPGAFAQPALFALEYALAETWRSWGVEPAAVLGHSLGEYVAACVAGVFSLEDGLRLVAERGRVMDELCPEGAMATVFAPAAVVARAVEPFAAEADIAAINGPENVVIAGSPSAVAAVQESLQQQGFTSRPLPASRAFHSPLIEPALDALEAAAARVAFALPRLLLLSNVTGAQSDSVVTTAAYWRKHARSAVRFADGVRALAALRTDAFLEIGPEPTLSKLGPACLPDGSGPWLASLRPGAGGWRSILEAMAGLYVRGVRIDWEAFDRGHQRRWLSLPTYPFERERYWVAAPAPEAAKPARPEPVARPAVRDALYRLAWVPRSRLESPGPVIPADELLSPAMVAERMRPVSASLETEYGTTPPANLARGSDLVASGYVVRALRRLGWEPVPGETATAEGLAERLAVEPQHHRLLGRMLEILAEDGWLSRHTSADNSQGGRTWGVVQPPEVDEPDGRLRELRDGYPAFEPELTLLGRCGDGLAGVLRGEVDPLHLLFPGGDTTTLERVYRDSPLARFANAVLTKSVAAAVRDLAPGRVLRVLELGAGTGGATASLLPELPPERTEYVFTDASSLFFPRARARFRAYPFVQYRTLDLERTPEEQGFAPEQFNVVVAANVLHATADLRRSLRHATRLLAPGGLLVLLEAAGPRRMLDLIFGLTEGWWKFADHDLRPNYPLLSPRRWLDLFAELGLTDGVAVPASSGSETSADQVVLLARRQSSPAVAAGFSLRNGRTQAEACGYSRTPEQATWVLLADRAGVGTALASALVAAGESVALAEAGEEFERIADRHYRIRPDRREDLPRLLDAVGRCRGIVHLWGLDADALGAALPRGCGSVLKLLHGAGAQTGRLWLVTRGAHTTSSCLVPAALWGISRAAREEYPGLALTLVDLDPSADAEINATRLASELLRPDDEPEVVFARGHRHVARLMKAPLAQAASQLTCRADGVYVVVGAGGLEMDLARELVTRGAGKVCVVGPNTPPRTNGCKPHAEDAAIVRRVVDLTRADELGSLLAQIQSEGGPVRGVVCVAEGLREDRARQDGNRLAAALVPSLTAAEVLGRFDDDVRPDFLAFLSPAPPLSALTRGRTAAAGAAAAFDAVVRRRAVAAISVSWLADEAVTGADLVACLDAAHPRPASVAYLPLGWDGWAQSNPSAMKSPVLSGLREELATAHVPISGAVAEDVRSLPPVRRRAELERLWREQLGQVLGMNAAQVDLDAPLHALGLDSLMAIQLKNRVEARLNVALPLRALLAGGASSQVLDRILATLGEDSATEATQPIEPGERSETQGGGRPEPLLNVVEQMSEAELDAVLRQLLPEAR